MGARPRAVLGALAVAMVAAGACASFEQADREGPPLTPEAGADVGAIDATTDDAAPAPKTTVLKVSASPFHTCAVFSDGRVKCWGLNAFGALGIGDAVPRGVGGASSGPMGTSLTAVDLGQNRRAVDVATGGSPSYDPDAGAGPYASTCACRRRA